MTVGYLVSRSQRASFEEKGYLIIKDAMSVSEISALKNWVQQVHDLPRTADCRYIPYDEVNRFGERVLCRTENFVDDHAEFGALLRGSKLLGTTKWRGDVNYKLAGSGGFDPHLDRTGYGNFKNIQHLSIALAADPSTASNGCIEIVEGSHKMHVTIGKDNCIAPAWVGAQEWVPVEMKAGELLIFGSSLAHRSGPNLSMEDRRTVYATYNPKAEGNLHDAYYEKRARLWPATHKRKDGVDYSEGVQKYAYGSAMRTIENLGGTLESRI